MSDRMRPISFGGLIRHSLNEYKQHGTIFGVRNIYRHSSEKSLPIFGEFIETPFGPAAGPHTQLAQNIIAAYAGGSRFFELKTVQTLDGEDLPVSKPCILARDEGYNVEWSTELTVHDALNEYIKAWFALKLLSRELGLGDENGFVFNMSVGYDLAGIKSEKIDTFIESLKKAEKTEQFTVCREWTIANIGLFNHIDEDYVRSISPRACRSITLSTLHGCPASEIMSIAAYLINVKKLNTYVKCNPTLLGYRFARDTLNSMGYGYLSFDEHHFNEDLQFDDAISMFMQLKAQADALGLEFGLKLSNTFPVMITRGELPGDEMYMSGKGLYPLTVSLADKLERVFDGKMRVSFSGGADAFNIDRLFDCGIWPITLATSLLKPGGYDRMAQLANMLSDKEYKPFEAIDVDMLSELASSSRNDARHMQPIKPAKQTKSSKPLPAADCYIAPCSEQCPIHQDITEYLDLAYADEYQKALEVICRKNPLPFMTGTLCPHRCQLGCARSFYEDSIHIRDVKLLCAEKGIDGYVSSLKPAVTRSERIAVIGGGPAGMAAAFFAARAGAEVVLFEKLDSLGGVPKHVIPSFRISDYAIDCDAKLLTKLGVEVRLGTEIKSVQPLYDAGFSHAVIAVGAWASNRLELEGGQAADALEFLRNIKHNETAYSGAKHAVIVGAGNTAMDAARAAQRINGISDVTIAYRRTVREMPADGEELELAENEGVIFKELVSPKGMMDGLLTLDVMELGKSDSSGRAAPIPTGRTVSIPCDLLISATSQKIDESMLFANGVEVDRSGKPISSKQNDKLWIVGDACSGPATIVEAIASARKAVDELLSLASESSMKNSSYVFTANFSQKKGVLQDCGSAEKEAERCLHCAKECGLCAEVCPNRANMPVHAEGHELSQVIHFDAMCNECGNCAVFCPHNGAPYRDKVTVFASLADFENSANSGFVPLDDKRAFVRADGLTYEDDCAFTNTQSPYRELMRAAWPFALELR